MLIKLTQRDGHAVLVNPDHVSTVETIHAQGGPVSFIVFAASPRHDGQPKTLSVKEAAHEIEEAARRHHMHLAAAALIGMVYAAVLGVAIAAAFRLVS